MLALVVTESLKRRSKGRSKTVIKCLKEFPRPEVGKLPPLGQIQFIVCFRKLSFSGTQPCPFVYIPAYMDYGCMDV